jgi:hypothetical protein
MSNPQIGTVSSFSASFYRDLSVMGSANYVNYYQMFGFTWVHLAVVFEHKQLTLYYNGRGEIQNITAPPAPVIRNVCSFGFNSIYDLSWPNYGQEFCFDEVKIFNRSLSGDEIRGHYNMRGDLITEL